MTGSPHVFDIAAGSFAGKLVLYVLRYLRNAQSLAYRSICAEKINVFFQVQNVDMCVPGFHSVSRLLGLLGAVNPEPLAILSANFHCCQAVNGLPALRAAAKIANCSRIYFWFTLTCLGLVQNRNHVAA